jgi:hypothetical protein
MLQMISFIDRLLKLPRSTRGGERGGVEEVNIFGAILINNWSSYL